MVGLVVSVASQCNIYAREKKKREENEQEFQAILSYPNFIVDFGVNDSMCIFPIHQVSDPINMLNWKYFSNNELTHAHF